MYPIKKKHTAGPNIEACANLLQQVYTSDTSVEYADDCCVPDFSFHELEQALRKMRKGKCADKDGIFAEIFLYSGQHHLEQFLVCLNDVLN